MKLPRMWLRSCRDHHHQGCQADLKHVPGLKLIDCESRHVIKAPPNAKYAALSYVWGRAQQDDNSRIQPASSTGPYFARTIRDAIFVTTALVLKYLWVVEHCIDQSSTKDKHDQIRQMDVIYQQSVITIMAASGQDVEAGLPGVDGTRTNFTIQLYII
jgi:Heterokaryon incompatibility protein (HET)